MSEASEKTEAEKDSWITPSWIYEPLNAEFQFDFDLAANGENTKHENFFGPNSELGEDALIEVWNTQLGNNFWLNPPYSMPLQWEFLKKASVSATLNDIRVVCLIPVAPETPRWRETVSQAAYIRFYYPRISFIDPITERPVAGARWPNAVVIFERTAWDSPEISWVNWKQLAIEHGFDESLWSKKKSR